MSAAADYTKGPWRIERGILMAGERRTWLFKLEERPGLGKHLPAIRALIEAAPDLLLTLETLTEWARAHTSPHDANSPHNILIAAMAVIKRAKRGRSPS